MIETVGEGLEKPDALPPLKIAPEEVLEFLVTRKQVPATWRRRIPAITASVGTALALVPEELSRREEGADRFGYFDCTRVLSSLMRTEPQTKTLLGNFTSARLRAWSAAVSGWRRDNAHLADAAEELCAIVRHGIPGARHEAEDASRKAESLVPEREEATRIAARHRAEYERDCAEWGIAPSGEGTTAPQLESLVSDLGPLFASAVDAIRSRVQPAASFYSSFASFVLAKDPGSLLPAIALVNSSRSLSPIEAIAAAAKVSKSAASSITKIFKENESKLAPARTPAPVPVPAPAAPATGIQIDWSAIPSSDTPVDLPSYDGIELADSSLDAAALGIETIGGGAEAASPVEEAPKREEKEKELEGIVHAFLWDRAWRRAVINDLSELREFLSRRREEATEGTIGSSDEFITVGTAERPMPPCTPQQLVGFIAEVNAALEMLEGKRVMRLLEIRESKHFVERVANGIEQKLEFARAQDEACAAIDTRSAELREMISAAEVTIGKLSNRAKSLADSLAKEISTLFDNREVSIS